MQIVEYTKTEGGQWIKVDPELVVSTWYGHALQIVMQAPGGGAFRPAAVKISNGAIYDAAPVGYTKRIATNECPVPDATERNEGKRILQTQQYLSCRIDSIEQLFIKMQADMQYYSPRAAANVRKLIKDVLPTIRDQWLEDTRRIVSNPSMVEGGVQVRTGKTYSQDGYRGSIRGD